jgi:hypothetical protein
MKISRVKIVFLMLISLSLGMLAASVQAAPPVGQWKVTFYEDDGGFAFSGTQSLCFEGGPNKGTWYSPTFTGWTGDWWRKGGSSDVIIIKGNYNSGLGNDGAKVELISISLMAGSWFEWTDNGSFLNWTQVKLIKDKAVCDPQPLVNMAATANPSGK